MAGVIVTKEGKKMDGTKGGLFIGDRHSKPSGGIKVITEDGSTALVEDGEPIIIPSAVNNPKKKSFDGNKMTAKEILDQINTSYGGVNIKKKGGYIKRDGGNINNEKLFVNNIYELSNYNTPIDANLIDSKSKKGHILDNLPKVVQAVLINSKLFEKEKEPYGKVSENKIAYHSRPELSLIYWRKNISKNPPVLVDYDSENNQLRVRDGNHRLNVYIENNIKEIPVIITNEAKDFCKKKSIEYKKKGGVIDKQEEKIIEQRWDKKKDSISTLSDNIQSLRYNVSTELKSDNEKVFLTALVIKLMDITAERVGNNDSASNGHYGITGLKKSHVKIAGNKITLQYIGKSGVEHEKSFTDASIVHYLKKAIKKSPSTYIFTTTDNFKVNEDRVNRYLSEYGITAKDIRGYSANKWLIEKLKSVIPAEKDTERKKQFNTAAKSVALKVGHGYATLKKHYLVPEIETNFIEHGKVDSISDLKLEDGGVIEDENNNLEIALSILKTTHVPHLFTEAKESNQIGLIKYIAEQGQGLHSDQKDSLYDATCRSFGKRLTDASIKAFPIEYEEGGLIKKKVLLAPNGKPTNLTPEQYELTRSDSFKNFFGDFEKAYEDGDYENCSKVIDSNGDPLVVYHGSPYGAINIFDITKSNRISSGLKEYGSFFTTNILTAEFYATKTSLTKSKIEEINAEIARIDNEMDEARTSREYNKLIQKWNELYRQKTRTVYPVFLNLRKIKTFNAQGLPNKDGYYKLTVDAGYKWATGGDAIEFLRDGRFGVEKVDGVRADNVLEISQKTEGSDKYLGTSFLVFNNTPQYIKLADGTNKTFDPNNPDIRFNDGGQFKEYADIYKLTSSEYRNTQFNEDKHSYLGSDYFEEFQIEEGVKDKYPNLIKKVNGLEYRKGAYGIVAVFDKDKKIGFYDGVAIQVSSKYQKRGIGLELVKIIKSINPNHIFGSMTPQGFNLMYSYHKYAIKDAIKKGYEIPEKVKYDYKELFKEGGKLELIAPNGKPSNLTPEQYKLVRTEAFKNWFGRWDTDPENSSKVVDENGEPLVVYHGSNSKHTIFEIPNKSGAMGQGIYLTTDKSMANFFGKNTYELFANIRNPKYVNTRKEDTQMLGGSLIYLQKKGKGIYDGACNEYGIWLAINPNQIKLSDGTNTTFDGSNPDIRYGNGGGIFDDMESKTASFDFDSLYAPITKEGQDKLVEVVEEEFNKTTTKEEIINPIQEEQSIPFKDVKEGDYVSVYNGFQKSPDKKVDEGLVTFKYANKYLTLDNDNERKYNFSNAYYIEKQPTKIKTEPIQKNMIKTIKGRTRKLMLPNGEEHTAVYAIVDLNDIKASHNEVTFSNTEGYPTVNGRNINDRNYKDDVSAQNNVRKIAENLEPETLISLSSTPSGTPIINKDGIVVSGNNRVMSLKLAKKRYPEKYDSYKKQLKEDSEIFGIDSYSDIEIPALVRIDESLPDKLTTEVLAAYNQETKKGERPVDKAIKLASILNDNERVRNSIVSIVDGYDTFSDLYSSEGLSDRKKLIEIFVQSGLIPEAQLPVFFDNGEFTEGGKDYIETLLSAIILTPDALKVIGIDGVRKYRQTIIGSLPVLITNKNLKGGASLSSDISDAVIIQYKIVQAGGDFSDYTHSQSLFTEDKPKEKPLFMNALMRVGKNIFKSSIKRYNDAVKDNEGASLFGETLSVEEIFDKTIKANVDKEDKKLIEQLYPKQDLTKKSENIPTFDAIKQEKDMDYDWDVTFSSGSLKGQKLSEQEIEFIDVYDDFIYSLTFVNESIFNANTGETVGVLSITNNPVKIAVILDNDIRSSQRVIRRLQSLANDSNRVIVENNSTSRGDRGMFPFLFVSKEDSSNYKIADQFQGKLDTPKKAMSKSFIQDAIDSGSFLEQIKNGRDAEEIIQTIEKNGLSVPEEILSYSNKKTKKDMNKVIGTTKSGKEVLQKFDSAPRDWDKQDYLDAAKINSEYAKKTKDVSLKELALDYAISFQSKAAMESMSDVFVKKDMKQGKLKISDIPESVKTFMPLIQQKAIVGSEEHWDVIDSLEKIISAMPKTYGTDGVKAAEKVIYLHYFYNGSDWYVVEKDMEREQLQAYGYVILNGDTENAEWGYINIEDLKKTNKVELDFFFEPIKFGELFSEDNKEEYNDNELVIDDTNVEPAKNDTDNLDLTTKVDYFKDELNDEEQKEYLDVLKNKWIPDAEFEIKEAKFESVRRIQGNILHFLKDLLLPKIEEIYYSKNKPENKQLEPAQPEQATAPAKEFKYYKGVNNAYKNAYELNRAIEELLDTKESGFTSEEKVFMSSYSGYGGLDKIGSFSDTELKTILYEYYTPRKVVEKMWGLAYKHGFKGGSIIEPASGIGEFIRLAPDKTLVTGYEINQYSAKIAKILYPETTIINAAFETLFIKNNASIKNKIQGLKKYSLVIGNPPYGKFGGKYAGMGEDNYTKAENYIEYFITRGLDLLESGGLLIMIIGAEVANGASTFLQKGISKTKKEIMNKAILVDAYRLPNGVFERTDVLSDIIVLRKK